MTADDARVRTVPFHLLVLLGYLLLSFVVTYPLIFNFTTQALGEHPPDRIQNMWNLWWVKVALFDQHTSPFHTNLLYYPQGADLYIHTLSLPSTLLTLVPLLLAGVVAAYNTSVIIAFVLAGYAGFRLVSYLTGSRAAGVLGGVIIGFNSLMMDHSRGQVNIMSVQWFLLCIEFYLRAWAGEMPRRTAVLAGVFFTLALLTVGYFEIYLVVFFTLHLVWALATRPEPGWGARLAGLVRQAAPVALWAGVAVAVLAGPYLLATWISVNNGVISHTEGDDGLALRRSADLLSFLVPPRGNLVIGQTAPWWAGIDPRINEGAYLGIVPVGLAILGFRAWRGQAQRWFWALQ
ncbi:MAG TPA: hypothetical protein VM536_12700, partial [Chloroflexia bacterium]|nr:hypothetical protein [Chloroflexia bacterium]